MSNKVCCGVSSRPVSPCPDDHTSPICIMHPVHRHGPRKAKTTMPRPQRRYSPFLPPTLSMSELVKTTLDHDSTDMLIDKWLEHRSNGHDAYHDWFRDVRERKHNANVNASGAAIVNGRGGNTGKQVIAWNKGEFMPENVFCRTVDTGRLIPLDRTWTTHVYHHQSMQERKLSMMPVVFTMVCSVLFYVLSFFFTGAFRPVSLYRFGLLNLFCTTFHYLLIVREKVSTDHHLFFLQLPELMLLRGMHDSGCDEVFIIVTDLKRQEMDDVTQYFKLVCSHSFGRQCKPSMERRILHERASLFFAPCLS